MEEKEKCSYAGKAIQQNYDVSRQNKGDLERNMDEGINIQVRQDNGANYGRKEDLVEEEPSKMWKNWSPERVVERKHKYKIKVRFDSERGIAAMS